MLTYASLRTLIDISKHASLSKKLDHLIIATNVYQETPLRFAHEEAAARYIKGYEEQKVLLGTGVGREMLTEAFQRLENLKTIGFRDFSAANRVRDGKSWSSWGATTGKYSQYHIIVLLLTSSRYVTSRGYPEECFTL
jgi:hypothetical protein